MSDEPRVVRSYQRLFRPDRRIYSIDGRSLPVPGGVPLAWVLCAVVITLGVLLLSARSPALIAAVAVGGGAWAWRLGRLRAAITLGACLVVGQLAVGLVLSVADWPLRLVVLPAVAATGLMHPARDGRSARRYAAGWLQARVAGPRRAGIATTGLGLPRPVDGRVRVASDEHRSSLQRGDVIGPAVMSMRGPVLLQSDRRGRRSVRAAGARGAGVLVDELTLADGERLEVRA